MNFPRKIYAIRHNVTNRVYIGSSANVDKRLMKHIYDLRAHKHHIEDMQSDFDQYGENFTFTILEDVFAYEDKRKEYEWMEKYQSHIRGIGYNYKDHVFKQNPPIKHALTFNGKTMSISKWAEEVGVSYEVLYGRIFGHGWNIEKALSTPCRKGEKHNKQRKGIN